MKKTRYELTLVCYVISIAHDTKTLIKTYTDLVTHRFTSTIDKDKDNLVVTTKLTESKEAISQVRGVTNYVVTRNMPWWKFNKKVKAKKLMLIIDHQLEDRQGVEDALITLAYIHKMKVTASSLSASKDKGLCITIFESKWIN